MSIYGAFFDALVVTLGVIVSFWLALHQSAGRDRTFLVRCAFCIWIVASGPMLTDCGDWVHLTWSAEVPLLCTFMLSGALLFALWPEDAAFHSRLPDERFERPPAPRIGPAWWFFAMTASLGAMPLILLQLFARPDGRNIGEPMRRVFELALWGFGGALPECLQPITPEDLARGVGHLPREVTVPVTTMSIAAYLWIAFCALALLGRGIHHSGLRRGFLLLSPYFVALGLLVLARNHAAPIAWFDPGVFCAPEARSGIWDSDPVVLRAFGPVMLATLFGAIVLAFALRWDRSRWRG